MKDTTNQSHSKRPETSAVINPAHEEVDNDQYEQDVSNLQGEWSKGSKSRSQAVLKTLMDKTRWLRRKWIEEDRPMVATILDKFPCLAHSRQVCLLLYDKQYCNLVLIILRSVMSFPFCLLWMITLGP